MDSERSRRTEFFIRRRNCNWTRKSDLSVAGGAGYGSAADGFYGRGLKRNRYLKRGIDGILDWIIKLTDTGASDGNVWCACFFVKKLSKAFKSQKDRMTKVSQM